MNNSIPLDQLPPWVLAIAGVVAIAQIAFEVWALVDMLKRPADELTLGGRKWLWAIIILMVNWVGAIIYLVAGRKPASVDQSPSAPASQRADAALDRLYGAPKEDAGK